MLSLREVPGYLDLPLARRARVRALVAVARRLTGPGGASSSGALRVARARLPAELSRSIRRALAPLRLPGARAAHLPHDALPATPTTPVAGPARASVIIATRGAVTLPQCVAALGAFTRVPHELIVVDDASPAPLDLPAHVRLVRHDAPRGFVASANRGAALAETGVLVFLNDDAVVTPGWLEALLAALEHPRAGLAGPSSNDTGDSATEAAAYQDLTGLLAHAASANGAPREVDKLSLFCAAIDRRLFERVGGLDEGYGLGGFEDDELCEALRRRGRKVLLTPRAFVHHHGSVTFGALGAAAQIARFEINRHRFERRWGVRWRAPETPAG